MFNEYALLPTSKLNNNTSYYHAEKIPDIVQLESPALLAFIDFHTTQPRSITKNELASTALDSMKTTQAKGLMVLNNSERVIGVITTADILSSRLTIIAQNNGVRICDVTVGMLMSPTSQLIGLNFKYISTARIGHIAKLLHDKNVGMLLVFEESAEQEQILRGVFSSSRLSKQLGMEIGKDMGLHTVADMNKRL